MLAALLLLVSFPQTGDTSPKATDTQSAVAVAANVSPAPLATENLLSMPTPKVAADSKTADGVSTPSSAETDAAFAIQPIFPATNSFVKAAIQPNVPPKPVLYRPYETKRQKAAWYGLMVVGHGAAAFDAWSTRRAISGGFGTESNPLLRPFSHSNALYAATQVSPVVMDLLGHKMMTSPRPWVRRMWWVPQTVGASFSFAAGVHNVGVVP